MLKELIEYIVKKLVSKPELVLITELKEDNKHTIEIQVDEHDLGRVIGKEGQTIKALRMLVASVAPEGKEIIVTIIK